MISTIPGFKSRLTNQLCLTTLRLIKPFITWIEIQGNNIGHAYGIGYRIAIHLHRLKSMATKSLMPTALSTATDEVPSARPIL